MKTFYYTLAFLFCFFGLLALEAVVEMVRHPPFSVLQLPFAAALILLGWFFVRKARSVSETEPGTLGRVSEKRHVLCGLLIAGALGTFGLFYMLKFAQSVRISRMNHARAVLEQAYQQFVQRGTVDTNGTAKPFVFTNLVTVDGVSYQCAVGIAVHPPEEGMLALSTNGVFVWLERKRAPKIIPVSGYVPPPSPREVLNSSESRLGNRESARLGEYGPKECPAARAKWTVWQEGRF